MSLRSSPAVCDFHILHYPAYGYEPLKSTQRHGFFFNLICNMELSDVHQEGKKIVTCDMAFLKFNM